MKRLVKTEPLLLLAVAAAALPAMLPTALRADSLYPVDKAPTYFADIKARSVGDILTILVSEQTQAVAQASTKATKSESGTVGPGTGPILELFRKFGIAGSHSLDGSGQTSRNGSLVGTISVVVKAVDANNNLIIEGVREITVNKEKQKMTFTGKVRVVDVSTENTVPSSLVADAQILYEGKGPVGDRQREGVITKIFKVLF